MKHDVKPINGLLWQRAAAFAARAHQNQLRKDDCTPYIAHPIRVALTIACVFGETDQEILAAALLHDTIEDTDTDYDDLHGQFGRDVADFVAAMSKDMRMIEPQREQAYDAQLAAGPWQSRLIKLADVYDNLHDTLSADSRGKQLQKIRRAIALAGDDPRLEKAKSILQRLIQSMK